MKIYVVGERDYWYNYFGNNFNIIVCLNIFIFCNIVILFLCIYYKDWMVLNLYKNIYSVIDSSNKLERF